MRRRIAPRSTCISSFCRRARSMKKPVLISGSTESL
jgi:hypothetical protein